MITIHNEITIDMDTPHEQTITLWRVSYGAPPEPPEPDDWPMLVEALRSFCARRGWLLETGDDPYQEKSLAVFAGGFSWPLHDNDDSRETDEDQA